MLPIVTPDEMRTVDAEASEPAEVLVARAGSAIARAAVLLLGGTYGRTVNIIAGKGNNGADGRVAGERLQARGVKVRVFDADGCPPTLPTADLVKNCHPRGRAGRGVEALWGLGFSRIRPEDRERAMGRPLLRAGRGSCTSLACPAR